MLDALHVQRSRGYSILSAKNVYVIALNEYAVETVFLLSLRLVCNPSPFPK